jgi:hypothetical protein
MAHVLDHRENNRFLVVTTGHCEMLPWRYGKATILEGLRELGQLRIVSSPTPAIEVMLAGTMRGNFFPVDSVSSPPGMGTGEDNPKRATATPISWGHTYLLGRAEYGSLQVAPCRGGGSHYHDGWDLRLYCSHVDGQGCGLPRGNTVAHRVA